MNIKEDGSISRTKGKASHYAEIGGDWGNATTAKWQTNRPKDFIRKKKINAKKRAIIIWGPTATCQTTKALKFKQFQIKIGALLMIQRC